MWESLQQTRDHNVCVVSPAIVLPPYDCHDRQRCGRGRDVTTAISCFQSSPRRPGPPCESSGGDVSVFVCQSRPGPSPLSVVAAALHCGCPLERRTVAAIGREWETQAGTSTWEGAIIVRRRLPGWRIDFFPVDVVCALVAQPSRSQSHIHYVWLDGSTVSLPGLACV